MPDDNPSFIFAFAPTLAGTRFSSAAHVEPFRRYLERALERRVRLIVPASYDEAMDALRTNRADAAMVGEVVSRRSETRGGVEPLVAQARGDHQATTYHSVIVTRFDTGVRSLPMLRGTSLGLVDGQSTSGYLVPRAMLREAGLDPENDVSIRLFASHLGVIEAVLAGGLVAGAVHEGRLTPLSLDRGLEYARIRVLARSRPIPTGPLVVRSNLDAELRSRLSEAMLHIHEADPEAASILLRQGSQFILASRRPSPTLKSIAALAGVSYATVSRVVNGSGYVAPATAERVRAIIDELGYAPNGNAKVLHGQQLPMVGLVVAFQAADASAALPGLVEPLRTQLAAAGVPLVLCPVGATLGHSLFIDALRDRRLGALIIGPSHLNDPDVAALSRTGHAVIALDVPTASPGMLVSTRATIVRDVLAVLGVATAPNPM
jgi:phosphonate transport system substrate-binding protein